MSTIVFNKSSAPPPPPPLLSNDLRFFINNAGFWCSIDENGVIIVYSGASVKGGIVEAIDFIGNPKTFSIVFDTPFPDNNYAVNITGVDNRNWTVDSRSANGFIINANANRDLQGQVFWNATHSGS